MPLNHLLFVLMSLIWGMIWLATKVALAAVPPVFFGAARIAVGTVAAELERVEIELNRMGFPRGAKRDSS